jgi:hypothetical protein
MLEAFFGMAAVGFMAGFAIGFGIGYAESRFGSED